MARVDRLERSELRKLYPAVFDTLDKYSVSLDRFLECPDIEGHELLRRLRNISAYDPRREPRRYSEKEARAACQSIRKAADLIERLNKRPDSAVLQGESWRLTHALPELLRNYARRVQELPKHLQQKWEPFKVALISQLVWYVKDKTGSYYDEEVSALIGAFLENRKSKRRGDWTATALKQWRARHASDIAHLGPLAVLPLLPRPSKAYQTPHR